ncbi:MAG TPA: T9SS type A sorting domain-containing protein [Saprospiraceae bacterium]|nr:T9SS type A sorting domain-containing protein [Saprospiraceae bacterium]
MNQKTVFIYFALLFSGLSLSAQLACYSNINLALDATGSGPLTPATILVSPMNPSYTYTLSKSTFNCSDIGIEQMVTVYESSGGELINSCYSNIVVEDKIMPPVCIAPSLACRSAINVALSADGTATLTPAEVLVGSLEPTYTYSVSPSSFVCSDVGSHLGTVTVTTSAGATNSCFFTVNVVDRRPSPPPCISMFFERMRFAPNFFWNFPIPPRTIIRFDAKLSAIVVDKKPKGELMFAISEDEVFDQSDIIVYSQDIKYPKKKGSIDVQGKFEIPRKMKPGKYFLLADIMSNKKKVDITIETYVLPFEIGYPNQNFGFNDQQTSLGNTILYPNPFDNTLNLQNDEDQIQTIKIFNIMGQNLKSVDLGQAPASFYQLDLTDFQKGIYLINVSHTSGNVLTKTIIKD